MTLVFATALVRCTLWVMVVSPLAFLAFLAASTAASPATSTSAQQSAAADLREKIFIFVLLAQGMLGGGRAAG